MFCVCCVIYVVIMLCVFKSLKLESVRTLKYNILNSPSWLSIQGDHANMLKHSREYVIRGSKIHIESGEILLTLELRVKRLKVKKKRI